VLVFVKMDGEAGG